MELPTVSASLHGRLRVTMAAAGLDAGVADAVLDGRADLPDTRCLGLISLDPPGIQELLLGSRRLRTRFGASTKLVEWDEHVRALKDAATLYAGGGQAVVLVPAPTADGLERRRQALVHEFSTRFHSPLGSAAMLVSPRMLVDGPTGALGDGAQLATRLLAGVAPLRGFGALVAVLNARLRREKDLAPSQSSDVTGVRCAECGARAAGSARRKTPEGEAQLCERCNALGKDLIPDQADALDGVSKELAWLAIDGTAVGSLLAKCVTIAEYERLSSTLLQAFNFERLKSAVEKYGVPVRPILCGGDDLLVLFPARDPSGGGIALSLALDLLDAIKAALPEGVGAGAGLVISRHLAARPASTLAHALLDRSKQAMRKAKTPGAFALDFEVVGGGAVLDDDAADRELTLKLNPGGLAATRRPYPLNDARAAADFLAARSSEDLSALYDLREGLLSGSPTRALIDASFRASRASVASAKFWEALGVSGLTALDWKKHDGWFIGPKRPWGPKGVERSTAIPDLVEIHDYVRREP